MMSEHAKVTASHRSRQAIEYVRQSTLTQLERNTESTARQYDLRERAVTLGWSREQVRVIDVDLGISGSVLGQRNGFETLVADVAMGQIGIVLALEVSRLARDNAAWYRLLDLAGACDTLVADTDGVYHPGLFNDRLVLGMKGMLSEAELHVLRARLTGGIRNKAARGELRTGLPVGLVWGEADDQSDLHSLGVRPDGRPGSARTAINEMLEAGLLDDVMARADAGELRLTGEGGFLPEMIKAVLERGLAAALTGHLGYEKGD